MKKKKSAVLLITLVVVAFISILAIASSKSLILAFSRHAKDSDSILAEQAARAGLERGVYLCKTAAADTPAEGLNVGFDLVPDLTHVDINYVVEISELPSGDGSRDCTIIATGKTGNSFKKHRIGIHFAGPPRPPVDTAYGSIRLYTGAPGHEQEQPGFFFASSFGSIGQGLNTGYQDYVTYKKDGQAFWKRFEITWNGPIYNQSIMQWCGGPPQAVPAGMTQSWCRDWFNLSRYNKQNWGDDWENTPVTVRAFNNLGNLDGYLHVFAENPGGAYEWKKDDGTIVHLEDKGRYINSAAGPLRHDFNEPVYEIALTWKVVPPLPNAVNAKYINCTEHPEESCAHLGLDAMFVNKVIPEYNSAYGGYYFLILDESTTPHTIKGKMTAYNNTTRLGDFKGTAFSRAYEWEQDYEMTMYVSAVPYSRIQRNLSKDYANSLVFDFLQVYKDFQYKIVPPLP